MVRSAQQRQTVVAAERVESSLEARERHPASSSAPEEGEGREARVIPLRGRSRWEDYFVQDQRTPLEPSLTTAGMVDLVSGQHQAVTPSDPDGFAPQPAALRSGPFEIPNIRVKEVQAPLVSATRLLVAAALAFVWLVLLLIPSPRPAIEPLLSSVSQVPAGGYARYTSNLPGVPSRWMVQVEKSLLVQVDSRLWEGMAAEDRVAALQALNRLGERPAEVLVVSEKSELLAEVYESGYHLYR